MSRASSQRRIAFEEMVRAARNGRELLLTRDIPNRWSSAHLMVHRTILLRPQLDAFRVHSAHGNEMTPHILSKYEFKGLVQCEEILRVPHAFQHFLSQEDTPSLAYAIPAFYAVVDQWLALQDKYPDLYDVIEPGIAKLQAYLAKIDDIPAYLFSMIINPLVKMRCIDERMPRRRNEILEMLYKEKRAYQDDSPSPSSGPTDTSATFELGCQLGNSGSGNGHQCEAHQRKRGRRGVLVSSGQHPGSSW
ncbi:hypothetical protein VNI00_018240 [Paramarasmius palmivorus]|uniref:Uncharacterized protein n=1 Tax=Paramarasmius palmivorus TaxID=297713 RepID=A0AAW0B1S6_9AGAR